MRTDPLIGAIAAVRDRHVIHGLQHVIAIGNQLNETGANLEGSVRSYFLAHPKLGSNDRTLIGDTVITTFRWRRRLQFALQQAIADKHLTGISSREVPGLLPAAALLLSSYSVETVAAAYARALPGALVPGAFLSSYANHVRGLDPWDCRTTEEIALRVSIPDWVASKLVDQYGLERALALAIHGQVRAPIILRNNVISGTTSATIELLSRAGIGVTATRLSPWGIRLFEVKEVRNFPGFSSGSFEIQDEGSQLVAMATGATPGMAVVDACAGAGGKSLALAGMMENSGIILSLDPDREKLKETRLRAARAGVGIVQTHGVPRDPQEVAKTPVFRQWQKKADAVLVDAPCSGSGTTRRNPDAFWRLSAEELPRYAQRQKELLDTYSRLVRPGGRLVYATCSLFRDENEGTVESWLRDEAGFEKVALEECLPSSIAASVCSEGFLHVYPDTHGTDGFFAAAFVRKGKAA